MANEFATIKNNQSSAKINLLRMEPARFLNDDLAAIGGGLYTITLSGFVITKVEENGSELTLVTTTPAIGEYSFNETTGLLTVYPNSAPSSTNAIVAFYYLFYTSNRFRTISQDPEDDATTKRDWLPRMTDPPSTNYNLEDITEGSLSISSSSITLINDQNEFQQYLGVNDSFFNKSIQIWYALDAVENIQKVFDGKILSVKLDNDEVTINLDDPLGPILQPALCGDDTNEVYVTLDDYPNANPIDSGRPIFIHFGIVSRYQTLSETVTNLANAQKVDPASLYRAYCVDFTVDISTSNNRTWIAARVNDDTLNFAFTPSNVDNSDANYTRLDGTAAQVDKFHIGDTLVANQAATDYYLRVYYVDRVNNYVYTTKEAAISTGVTVGSNDLPVVVVTNDINETYYLLVGRDYSITKTTTAGGNKLIQIDLANNFEANHAGLVILDPTTYFVRYRVKPSPTNQKHGDIVKYLLEKTGLAVDSTSISNANTTFDKNVNFSIPNFDQTDYDEYIRYVEDILKSVFGYLTLANDFEIEYYLLDTPSSTTIIDDTDIVKDSFRVEILYRDLISKIIAFNPHYASDEVKGTPSDSPSVTLSNNKTIHLHKIDKTIRFRHVLASINSRLTAISAFRSERKANYIFRTKISNIDSIVGDEFRLTKDAILGGDATKDIKVLGLDKSTDETSIIASDLYNI